MFKSIDLIPPKPPLRYGVKPLPDPYDSHVQSFINKVCSCPPDQRLKTIKALSRRERMVLSLFSTRAASLAVQQASPFLLVAGITAVVLTDYQPDYRDQFIRLGVLRDAAQRLDADFDALVVQASEYGTPEGRSLSVHCLSNKATLAQIGYTGITSKAGFHYKPLAADTSRSELSSVKSVQLWDEDLYMRPEKSTYITIAVLFGWLPLLALYAAFFQQRMNPGVLAFACALPALAFAWAAAFKVEVRDQVLTYRTLFGGTRVIPLEEIKRARARQSYKKGDNRLQPPFRLEIEPIATSTTPKFAINTKVFSSYDLKKLYFILHVPQ